MVDATCQAAAHLSRAAERLDAAGHSRGAVGGFMLRCVFTLFASGIGIVPERALVGALETNTLRPMWLAMVHVLGVPSSGIFADPIALPLDKEAARALTDAAGCDWGSVELSILGTLVEGALEKKERHALGAHYTPRAYVERLVRPTMEEPLRKEWETVQGLSRLSRDGTAPHHTSDESAKWLLDFHAKLCSTRVLDPACGTGNFLIVALETLYRIEDEVLAEIAVRDLPRPTERVSPKQMRGIEINPRAAEICRLVLNLCHLRRCYRRD